jgi:hypothetical protein
MLELNQKGASMARNKKAVSDPGKNEEEQIFSKIIELPPESRKRIIEMVLAYEFFLANKDLVFSDQK